STALTRDGSFQLDANGNLTTSTGELVQPPIQVPKGTQPKDISIGPDGTVTVGTKSVGKIAVVDVPSSAGLQALGNNLFAGGAASGTPAPSTTQIQRGALETSNVDMADTMSQMLDAQRSFELSSRAIKTQDELLDVANQIIR